MNASTSRCISQCAMFCSMYCSVMPLKIGRVASAWKNDAETPMRSIVPLKVPPVRCALPPGGGGECRKNGGRALGAARRARMTARRHSQRGLEQAREVRGRARARIGLVADVLFGDLYQRGDVC